MRFYRSHTYSHKGENVTLTKSHKPDKAGTGQRADSGRDGGFIGRTSGRSAGDTKLYAIGSKFRYPFSRG